MDIIDKQCFACSGIKSILDFGKRKDSKDGYTNECKACRNIRQEKFRRSRGIKPVEEVSVDYSLLTRLAESLGIAIDIDRYYLSGLCANQHDWMKTGYSLRNRVGGHKGDCLECSNLRSRTQGKRWREANPDHLRYIEWLKNPRISPTIDELLAKAQSDYFARLLKEQQKELNRGDYLETKKQQYKERYLQNPDRERQRVTAYKNANPDKVLDWADKRMQALAKQSDGSVTVEALRKLFGLTTDCIYCGLQFEKRSTDRTKRKTIDHLIPISKGGSHAEYNLVICCQSCNSAKSSKDFSDWVEELAEPYKSKCLKLYQQRFKCKPEQMQLSFVY
jgi:5-methylcytosine-specific restriction endonuclease McrA